MKNLLAVAALSLVACNHVPLVLEWSNITPTPGCYFLSGPRNLGSEYPLGERGTLDIRGRTVTLVAGDAHFKGTIDGDTLTLSRRVQCEPFPEYLIEFTETLTGELGDEHATYTYQECTPLPDGSCEPSYCGLSADVETRLARRNEPSYAPPASFCADFCAHRDAVASEIECANDGCLENCVAGFDGRCDREIVELGDCEAAQDASAYVCFGEPSLQLGNCDAQLDTYFACAIAPPAEGSCVEL